MPCHRVRTLAALVALTLIAASPRRANSQVAFFPNIGTFSNGVSLGVTPVISADRRYVRMTINPQFAALEGFDSYPVPGAVSGGGSGTFGGGLRSVVAPGPTFVAGMDGIQALHEFGDGSKAIGPVGPTYSADASPTLSVGGFRSHHERGTTHPPVRPKLKSSRRTTRRPTTRPR